MYINGTELQSKLVITSSTEPEKLYRCAPRSMVKFPNLIFTYEYDSFL